MKKILILMLALLLVFSLVACNGTDDPNNDDPLNRDPGTTQNGGENNNSGENNNGTQSGNENPGTQGSEETPGTQTDPITSGGEVGVSAPKTYEIPNNVKMVQTNQSGPTEIVIKIGNDYYYSNTLDGDTIEKYFKYNSDIEQWVYYKRFTGTSWQLDSETYSGDNGAAYYENVMTACFGYIILSNDYANSDPNDGGVALTTTGRSQKIAGIDAKEYTTSVDSMKETFWLADSGICLGYSGLYETSTVTAWDTSVTSFGVDLP